MALREACKRDQRDRIKSDCICEECGKVCKSVGGLKSHVRMSHRTNREESRECPKCGLSVTTQSNLTNHMKTCNSDRPGYCPTCKRGPYSRTNLSRHKKFCAARVPEQPEKIPKKTTPEYPCGVCKQAVTSRRWSIYCVDCMFWMHRTCVGMSVPEIRSMNGYRWHCGCAGLPDASN